MKQTYPFNGTNQSVSGGKFQFFPGSYESGWQRQFYRSVIAAVSGSLFMVTGEHAAAQTVDSTAQTTDQMVAERAQSSPPVVFGGLDMEPGVQVQYVQWPAQPLEPAGPPIVQPSAPPVTPPPPPENSSTNVGVAPSVSANPPEASDTSATLTLPPLPVQPTVYKNEVSASADFMYGTGTITVPLGYALRGTGFPVSAVSANRSTVYYGGTVSYSYGRSWYLDFSGENGRSTGSTSLTLPGLIGPAVPASFDVNDTWFQIYLRYNFQNFLAGTRFRAYLRGGVSLVGATLTTVNDPFSSYHSGAFYSENDKTFDVLGNLGFGLTYSLYSTVRLKVGLQLEGEGFGGNRSQDITETFVPRNVTGNATIDNTVYGALGRFTLHADYRLGQSGRWKLTGDAGIMTKYSFISYPDGPGLKDELLWGPYVKVGASFVF
ncbi:MAG TPA: hypothetical protein VMF08_19015 [Candidatus Sulfotelmatobacter sp.]|nr:hypothetical protein [Candidatus Sulfotelmatobacter sp.]